MPHLLIRGIGPEGISSVSVPLVEELSGVFECPPDHILLECLHTTSVFGGRIVPSYPFVEVNWFDRGTAKQGEAAACIDRHFRSLGLAELEIAFRTYEPGSYYANGERLGEPAQGAASALEAENKRLKDELRKTRAAAQAGTASAMSSRLRDALRE